MGTPILILVVVLAIPVAVILAAGLMQFGKGGAEGARRSNKLMQYRIMAQALVVLVVLVIVTLSRG